MAHTPTSDSLDSDVSHRPEKTRQRHSHNFYHFGLKVIMKVNFKVICNLLIDLQENISFFALYWQTQV